jgi:hypothetical protein
MMILFKRDIERYTDGFRQMPHWGKTLWFIILLKLFVMFFIFKLLLFRDTLKSRYAALEDRANHTIEQLTNTKLNDGTH